MSKTVRFNNTQRDSNQANLSAYPSALEIVRAEPHADEVGWGSIQVGGGTFFDVPTARGRDPWDEFRIFCKAYPDMTKTILFRGDCTVGYDIYPKDVVRAAIRKYAQIATETPINNGSAFGFTIFDGLNDTRNQENAISAVNDCVRDGMNVFAQGAICLGKTSWFTVDKALQTADKLAHMGVRNFYLKDAVGVADPELIFKLVERLKKEYPHDICIHTHNTNGMAYRMYLAAIEAGVDAIDVAHPAAGENVGQPSALRMLDMMYRHPSATVRERAPDLNLDAIARDINSIASLRYQYSGVEPFFDREVFDALSAAKAPGGAASTLKGMMETQFKARGLDWKAAQLAIYKKQAEILPEIGDPFQVTPHAKNTTAQVAMMLMLGDGKMTNEMATYLTGGYGSIPSTPDPTWTDRALKQKGMTKISNEKPSDTLPLGLETAKNKLIAAGIDAPTEEDVLTVAILNKGDQGLRHVVAKNDGTLKPMPAPELPKYARDITGGSAERHERNGVTLKTQYDVFKAIGGSGALLMLALNALEAEKKGFYKTPEITEEEAKAAGRAGPKFYRDEFRSWREPAAQTVKAFIADVPLLLYEAGFKEGQQLATGIDLANKMIRDACEAKGVTFKNIPVAAITVDVKRHKKHGIEFPEQEESVSRPWLDLN